MPRTDQNSAPAVFKVLRWLMLAAIPLNAVFYAMAWNQLPERIATHFAANGQPNGWMSRQDSLTFSIVLTAVIAIVGVLVISRVRTPDFLSWAGLGLLYFVLGTILWGTASVISYNVSGHPVDPTPIIVIGVIAVALTIGLALLTRRGSELPAAHPFATETHSSPLFAFVMAASCVALALIATRIPVPIARVAVGVGSCIMLGAAAMAGTGFHYLFSKSGFEVRTLGLRLRSIPVGEIRSYAADRWNALGGYGIRGVGNRRAYVWGNRGVRIQTSEGEIFLGHNEPQRIIRDLDKIVVHPLPATSSGQGTQKVLN